MKTKTQTQLSNSWEALSQSIKRFGYGATILMMIVFAASSSHAADFYPATTTDLILAIQQSETNGQDDIIHLTTNGIYKLTAANNGENGFPKITTKIRILGNGAIIERDAASPLFRFFENSGDLTLENLTLRGGKVSNSGGGAILSIGKLSILCVVLEKNTVDGTSGPWPGGAVYNSTGSVVIDGSTFRNNTAPNGGGLASDGNPGTFQPASVSINNSSFVYNTAVNSPFGSGMGGGIFLRGAHSADVTNTTIAYNKGLYGGGICFHTLARYDNNNQLLTAKFRNVTIANNRATSFGGGINYQNCSGSIGSGCYQIVAPDFGNSIIANNIAPQGRNYDSNYAYKSSGYNVIGLGKNTFGIDPDNGNNAHHIKDVFLTVNLTGLGGLSSTGAAGGDSLHPTAPVSTSLIIDKANPAFCTATDQLGFGRVGTCDIGAVEYRECTAPPADMTAWWPFDSYYFLEDFTTWSFPNHANLNPNGPAQTSGMVGGSATFTNANQVLEVPHQNDISLTNSCMVDGGAAFSIDAWIKTSADGLQVILDKRANTTSGLFGYHLFVYEGRLGFQLADGIHSNYLTPLPSVAGVDLRDNKWHFVAVTVYVRCQRNGVVFEGKLYIDDKVVQTFIPRGGDYFNNAPLRIGGHSFSPFAFFNGSLDEIEIFQRTLSGTEVKALYDAGWAGKCGKKEPPSCQPQCN
ncbi:MAG: LamG-like jellyroll fold domain-containing protein [Blastocatellia bacterium]